MIDALAPTNFAISNPKVIKEMFESNGENLVRGLDKLLHDIERSKNVLSISTTDVGAFTIGKNIAASKGKVIFQNDLMQLIHYKPLLKQVFSRPILVIPPWINRFYILDLSKQNSLVNWLLNMGYNVFMISWVNPTKEHAQKDFSDYMQEGPLAAFSAMTEATGSKEVLAIGYCLGGTLLASTAAYMAKKKDTRLKSASFMATLIDFEDGGDLSIFVDDEQLKIIEKKMAAEGYLDGSEMSATFSLLRSNDMIWSYIINNYMLGKDPIPFDILHWNADCTRMPAYMHSFYLRNMYQKNLLIKPNGISLAGVKIDVSKIEIPCYFLAAKDDHIVPWQSSYAATQVIKNSTFVLSSSGHVAAIINSPAQNKYCHWHNSKLKDTAEEWNKSAKEVAGSWWPNWHKWQEKLAGKLVPAIDPGQGKLKAIENAPGSYVLQE